MSAGDKGRDKGEVIVFTGPGKAKTTAALGVALRTIGYDKKVIFVYFTGPRYSVSGEVKTAVATGGNWRMIGIKSEAKDASYLDDFAELVDNTQEALTMARTLWLHECDLLILDDITFHLDRGSINITQVLALIDDRPSDKTILLTGPSAPVLILQRADLVTHFLDIKVVSPRNTPK